VSAPDTAEATIPQLRISAEREAGIAGADGAQVVYKLRFALGDEAGEARVHIPAGRVPVAGLVPVFQFLTDTLVYAAQRVTEQQGRTIACGPGCAACCHQAVPVGEAEVLHLAMVVGAMAPPQQAKCRARFERVMAELRAAGLLARAHEIVAAGGDEQAEHELAVDYFAQKLACPFLDEGSCSIYAHRPLRCREHVVASPPERCMDPELEAPEGVLGLRKASPLLYRFGDGRGGDRVRCVLLPESLEWVARHRHVAPATFPGPVMFENYLRALLGSTP